MSSKDEIIGRYQNMLETEKQILSKLQELNGQESEHRCVLVRLQRVVCGALRRCAGSLAHARARAISTPSPMALHRRLVIDSIKPLDPSRKCFQMIGGVLVERTVGDVLPIVEQTRDSVRRGEGRWARRQVRAKVCCMLHLRWEGAALSGSRPSRPPLDPPPHPHFAASFRRA